jgi:hypothetical protein
LRRWGNGKGKAPQDKNGQGKAPQCHPISKGKNLMTYLGPKGKGRRATFEILLLLLSLFVKLSSNSKLAFVLKLRKCVSMFFYSVEFSRWYQQQISTDHLNG